MKKTIFTNEDLQDLKLILKQHLKFFGDNDEVLNINFTMNNETKIFIKKQIKKLIKKIEKREGEK